MGIFLILDKFFDKIQHMGGLGVLSTLRFEKKQTNHTFLFKAFQAAESG